MIAGEYFAQAAQTYTASDLLAARLAALEEVAAVVRDRLDRLQSNVAYASDMLAPRAMSICRDILAAVERLKGTK